MRSGSSSTPSTDITAGVSTRRTMLKRMGSAGLLATAGAGLVTLARPGSALAQGGVPQVSNSTGLPMSADCCVICSRAEFHCNGGKACTGSGECCYFCDGCGLDNFYCIQSGGCQSAVEVCN